MICSSATDDRDTREEMLVKVVGVVKLAVCEELGEEEDLPYIFFPSPSLLPSWRKQTLTYYLQVCTLSHTPYP